jgi:DNA-binding response OmpR family regulator
MTEGKILIVDDVKENIDILMELLDFNQLKYVGTSNPMEVEKMIIDHKVDLVLLDWMMPIRSGMNVLKDLRKHYSQLELPIIIITAHDNPIETVKALKEGANDYITKPIDFDITTSRINTQLRIKQLNADLLQYKKNETINALIATLNHEINNPLSICMAQLELLIKDCDKEPMKEKLKRIENGHHRIKDIIQKINKLAEEAHLKSYVNEVEMFDLKKD